MKYFDSIVLISAIILCAYCPWISYEQAVSDFQSHAEVAKTLQPNCDFQVVQDTIKKTTFGYIATVTFDCTTAYTPHFPTGENRVFLSFFKVFFNMPHPVVN